MMEPVVVPDTLGAAHLLEQLRGQGLQFAVVIDEYGGTSGVVTVEDMVEELIGELEDEHDRYQSPLTRRGRSVSFDASLRPDEVLARTGVQVPEDDDWDTVNGYLAATARPDPRHRRRGARRRTASCASPAPRATASAGCSSCPTCPTPPPRRPTGHRRPSPTADATSDAVPTGSTSERGQA